MAERVATGEAVPEEVRLVMLRSRRRETVHKGRRTIWREWGKGKPMVLIHGGHGSWLHWLRNIDTLSRRFRVIAVDMPSYGESDALEAEAGIQCYAEHVAMGLDRILSGEHATLCGFSFGGVVAGYVAGRLGDALSHVIFVGTGGLALTRPPMAEMVRWRGVPHPACEQAHRRNLEILMIHDPAEVDDVAVWIQAHNAERTRGLSRPISLTDTLARQLPHLGQQLTFIWGEQDATAKGYLEERRSLLSQLAPHAGFSIVPGAGHWLQYEHPEGFEQALRRHVPIDTTGTPAG
jgi:pimeloyl-ACP methyl ester carboxylesterase